MSETVLPEKEATPPKPEAPVAGKPIGRKPRREGSGSGLAAVALVVAVLGVAAAGWGVWQVRQLQVGHRQQADEMESLNAEAQQARDQDRQLIARLDALPPSNELEDRRRLLVQLQTDQQHLSQRLETVLGESRQAWRLAEAEHLLRLASLRLSALQDIVSARALVQGADEILRDQNDPGAYAAREQLARSLEALNSTQQPDRTGLFLRLAALREQSAELNAQAPQYHDRGESLFGLTQGADPSSRWVQWWDSLSRYVRVDFNADRNIRPLLAGQSLNQVRLALSLTLEQAQWAALNGQTDVYQKAMQEAQGVLRDNFDRDNPQTEAMRTRLDELAKEPVSVVTPDLRASLDAVQAYLQRRQNVEAEARP